MKTPRNGRRLFPAGRCIMRVLVSACGILLAVVPVCAAKGQEAMRRPQGQKVSFATQVAPVLIDSCLSCHGGFETESGFNLGSFPGLIRGGRGGAAIQPGRAADSLLVKKIRGKGIDGQRMPLGGPNLSDEVIDMIARWIDEGARLDVAGSDVQAIAAAGRSQALSEDDLAEVRRKAAVALWKQVLPDESPEVASRGSLTVIANLPTARVESLAVVAASAWDSIHERLVGKGSGRGASQPLIKGGIVLYAFARPYDFSEFWLAQHGSERPRGVTARVGSAGDVIYAAMVALEDEIDAAGPMAGDAAFAVTEQLAAAVFAARAAPSWFAQGAGRTLAASIASKSPAARRWRKDLPEKLSSVGSAEDFLAGWSDPAATASVAGGFVDRITMAGRKLPAMLAALDAGTPFEEAFTEEFREPSRSGFEAWAKQEAARNRRR